MKKLFKKLGLSFATVMCVACVGVGAAFGLNGVLSAANAESAIDFYVSGAGVRLINDANGAGIRFHTRMADADYATLTDGDKTGTLIIPEIRYDGELTLDDLNKEAKYRPVHIDTTDIWWDAYVDGYMQSTAYLYNVPESAYGARYVARSYVKYANGDIVYTAAAPYTSMSDVATKVINSNETELKKTQVVPYVVDEVTVKYVMPDGSTETETVAYGSKLSGPTYNRESYAINATEQYGNAINFATYEATLPVTIDVELTAKPKTTAVEGQLIKGLYGAAAPERAWSNGPTGTAVTEGIPNGYSSMIRLDWYQQSTSQWKVNSNPLYRSQFNQNDISAYDRVTFAMKLETNGDAYVAARNKAVNFGNNKWLYFELIQTSANVWTLTITDDAGAELYKVTDAKADTKTNGSGLGNDYDSVASLVFSRTGYYGAVSGDTSKWEASHMVALYPCTSQEMTASVYFTEILGYSEDVLAIPSEAITVADAVALTGTTNPNFAIVDNTEEAPAFFNSVTAFKSEKQWGDSYILGSGDLSAVNVKNYSEVWFAVKMDNGQISETPSYATVDGYASAVWVYFHLIQQDNTMTDTAGNPTIAWTIEISKADGTVWKTITDQHANANDTIGRILDWSSDDSRIVFYQNRDNLSQPTYLYSTEVRGILKDGVTPPSSGTTETTTAMDIPDNAKGVRNYVWRDDRYALTAHANVTMAAPEGYSYVIEDVWNNHHTNITNQYTYAMDQSLDITAYSDLYFAMKIVDGTRIYVANNTSGAHYTGTDWLYIHYHQESTGVWSYDVASPDGYSAASKSTISATTIKALIDGKIYGVRETVDMTTTKTYFTEVRGIPVDDTPWGDRAIWSAIDGATFADEYIAIPAGFTSLYKYEGMSVTDAKCDFAALDLSNTIYEQLRFGFINSDDFSFKAGYTYVGSDGVARNATTIASHQGDWPKMNVVTLTKNDDGSWHVTMECKRWFDTADNNSKMTEVPFEADVTANSLSAIMSTFMYSNGTKANVAYCTEVRGTHTHANNNTKSLGNGYLQDYCICGETIGDAYEFAHGIVDEAVMVKDSIWRANNYALSTPDQEAPAGFDNIEMYRWNYNTANGGAAWGASNKDMSLTCLDEADVSAYDEVWFAMKNVGGTGFYVRNASKYEGSDWLYYHLVKVDGAWTLSLSSPDGYVAENVQTGIVGNTLQKILQYHAKSDAEPWDSGAYPTKADGDTTTDVRIYFTEILGIIKCEHTAGVEYVSNGDGTHNEVCANCQTVMVENVACEGGEATCDKGAICEVCGVEYTDALGHRNTTWSWGKEICGVCGETVGTAVTVANSAIIESTNAKLTISNNAAGVTAPAGFSSVTNLFSASGNTWPSKILGSADYAGATLDAYDEVWFAIAIQNGHFTNSADSWKNLDADNQLVWIKFHMTQTATDVWTVAIYVGDTLYKTFENRPGNTIYKLTENNNNGLRLVIYQQTANNLSNADVNIYATEVLGRFETGISPYATNVWDHIWNADNVGTYVDGAVPEGFTKVNKVTWKGTGANNYWPSGKVNASTDISKYSDLWFAMKVENTDIWCEGIGSYTGGNWLYFHLHQNSDGTWSKSFKSIDGWYNDSAQANLAYTNLKTLMEYAGSGIKRGSYPNWVGPNIEGVVYSTNVVGVLKCDGTNHSNDVIVSNGDGTHSVSCRCGEVVSTNATCSGGAANCLHGAICSACGYEYQPDTGVHTGGEATCEHGAICTVCGTEYTEPTAHTAAWVDDSYVCSICDSVVGSVNTHYETQQDVALFTNAAYAEKGATEANAFDASAETAANIDFSGFTNGLTISAVKNVKLNGVPFDATVANNILTINVIPYEVFGEYTLTATITVEGKDFDVEMSVLIITDLITDNNGLLNVRKVLRGQDLSTPVTATYKGAVYAGYGNNGGDGTMNGTGYYKLGANISLSNIIIGAHNQNYYANVVYVLGTNAVPFVGTFDGAGYVLSNFKSVMSAWNNSSLTGGYTNMAQDVSSIVVDDPNTTDKDESSEGVTMEQEGSFFGIMNGLVKNLAITKAQFGQNGNIVLGGTGTLEDVYVDVARLQAPRYGGTTENLSAITAPFTQRLSGNGMTFRNVVIDLLDCAFAESTATITTHYPALIGNGLRTAENVAVYGFDTAWINDAGLGNVLRKNFGEGDVSTDGSAVGIYVEYRDGNENATNGASFWMEGLHNARWKVVNGIPYLMNVSVDGTASSPSTTPTVGDLNENFIDDNGTQYYIAWSADLGEYAMFIKNAMYDARGLTLAVGAADLEDTNTKQIIIGTYYDYGKYVFESGKYEYDLSDNDEDYGVYLVDRTFFVLAESDEGFELAAQKFCRETFGYNEVWFDEIVSTSGVITLADINAEYLGTSRITFSTRKNMNTSTSEDQTKMGFSKYQPYTDYLSMHNATNYFGKASNGETDEKITTPTGDNATAWATLASEKGVTASNAFSSGDNDDDSDTYQLCYLGRGNKATFNAMVEHVVGIITAQKEAKPNMKVINLMLEDNTDYCSCTACAKFSKPSIAQQIFLNAVQQKLNTEGVGVGIEFFSYNKYSPAPILSDTDLTNLASIASTLGITYETKTVTYDDTVSYKDKIASSPYRYTTVLKAEDGLRLWWTSHEANHSFPLEHEANAHMYLALQAWIASIGADNVDVFMYQATYRDYFIPLNTWEYQILWYQSLNNLGVNNYMFNLGDRENSSSARTGFSAFKTYIDSRAMRDSSVTFDQLKDEFFGVNGYYGPAGPTLRTFFEELVDVYEGHKQGGNNAWVSTGAASGNQIAFTQNTNTLGVTGNGYAAGWFLNYYDKSSNPNYHTYHRQTFFNGSYGYNVAAEVFGGRASVSWGSSSKEVTPQQDVYVHSNYASQLATLEAWYNCCQTALTKVDSNSEYAKRIKLEMLFPEYVYLVYYSKYTINGKGESPNSVTSSIATDSGTINPEKTDVTHYQDFYNRVKALGVTKPSEFYTFDSTTQAPVTDCVAGTSSTVGYFYIYQSFWKNWGIKA